MHIITATILDVSDSFQNTNLTIHKRLYVSPPPYYLDWFEKYYPNVSLNRDEGPFCLQCMNGIQGKTPAGQQCNKLLDAVVTILKYNKNTIDHAIYINVSSDFTVSYPMVFTYDVLNAINNETVFPEVTIVLKKILILRSKKDLALST